MFPLIFSNTNIFLKFNKFKEDGSLKSTFPSITFFSYPALGEILKELPLSFLNSVSISIHNTLWAPE